MNGTVKPEDLVPGPFGVDHLNRIRPLLGGATAVAKGDTVRVTDLSFGPRGEPRSGTVERADHSNSGGMVLIAAHAAPVGRPVTCVSWLPMQMDTTGSAVNDPLYLAANGRPTLTDPGSGSLSIGYVVSVGAEGSILLQRPVETGRSTAAGGETWTWSNSSTNSQGSDMFLSPGQRGGAASTSPLYSRYVSKGVRLSNLTAYHSTAAGNGNRHVYVLVVDSVDVAQVELVTGAIGVISLDIDVAVNAGSLVWLRLERPDGYAGALNTYPYCVATVGPA